MARFLQYLFDGLSVGAVYSLLALGLVVVYRGSGHLNFAQGEMALSATYMTWQFNHWGVPLAFATLLGMATGFVIGALTEVALVSPINKKSPFAVFVVSIGLFLGLNSLDTAVWGANAKPFGSLFPNKPTDFFTVFGAHWRYTNFGVLLVVLALTALIFALFRYTKLGLAMRAVAANPESARMVGIPTSTITMISWGMAAAVGALGGALVAGLNTNVGAGTMFTIFIYASAAATLGGFDSPGGAVIAGLGIGVIENMAAGYQPEWIGQDLRLGVALVIIFVVLLLRPSGLFGSKRVERV
jgi:branched-chain amino acid transport system permease protein